MPILGIVASSKATTAADTGAMFPIQSIPIGAAGATDVTFTNIPSTYKHLQIRAITKSTTATSAAELYFQFNSDTGNNYSRHGIYGTGSGVSAYGQATMSRCELPVSVAASSSSNIFGMAIIDILDYADTNKYKTMRGLGGTEANGASNQNYLGFYSSLWQNTNAITSIKFYIDTGNFAQYSQFALYGIKGA